MKKISLFSLILLFMGACSVDSNIKEHTPNFSISAFLKKEIEQHQQEKIRLDKSVFRDEMEESKVIEFPNWEHEMKPFLECDLEKPAYKNLYDADTIQSDSTMQIVYTTADKKAPVRRMQLDYQNQKLQKIEVSFEKTNTWFSLKRHLIYRPHIGYQIKGEQKMTLSEPSLFDIKVKFIQ